MSTDETLSYNPDALAQLNVLITSQKLRGGFKHAFKESRDIFKKTKTLTKYLILLTERLSIYNSYNIVNKVNEKIGIRFQTETGGA